MVEPQFDSGMGSSSEDSVPPMLGAATARAPALRKDTSADSTSDNTSGSSVTGSSMDRGSDVTGGSGRREDSVGGGLGVLGGGGGGESDLDLEYDEEEAVEGSTNSVLLVAESVYTTLCLTTTILVQCSCNVHVDACTLY